ncbi:MAG: YggS family pyridoxal phosphate-dependent enzyme [Actinomycetota bacterium]
MGAIVTPASVVAALEDARARIDAVVRQWSHPVNIVAVTKGFGGRAIDDAVAAGVRAIGENYAQELLAKRQTIDAARSSVPIEVHFIGGLQRNKVRQLIDVVDVWSSLDRESIIDEVAKRAPGARVQVQVNATDEASKSGAPVGEVPALIERARAVGLDVVGLMTIGPTHGGPEAARPAFARVRAMVDEFGLARCSMGMSADLEVAIEEGSTEVRLGTALFGPRPPRQ